MTLVGHPEATCHWRWHPSNLGYPACLLQPGPYLCHAEPGLTQVTPELPPTAARQPLWPGPSASLPGWFLFSGLVPLNLDCSAILEQPVSDCCISPAQRLASTHQGELSLKLSPVLSNFSQGLCSQL